MTESRIRFEVDFWMNSVSFEAYTVIFRVGPIESDLDLHYNDT